MSVIVVASVGLAIGVLWEVAEWIFDAIAPRDIILGKDDTMADLLYDTGGAVLAGVLGGRSLTSR